MLFNSVSYLVFLPLVFFSYWALPGRWRPWLLLAASCYFYMAFVPYYILVLLFLITIDYFLAHAIERATGHVRRLYCISAILSNLSLLFVFKYFNFFNENITQLAQALHWNYSLEALSLLLPLGLSFHIFQSLAYIIEVHKGRYSAEKRYFIYALYVMFFPQLVAGPIERPAHLLPQLHAVQTFDYGRVVSGLRLVAWGLFKKIAIANNLALLVDFVYAQHASLDASAVLIGVAAFSVQIYADFSGYSDIAIGSARMLGIELVQNFRQPYFARSIAEFWRRWHISLSSWFRDYVYYPLQWKKKEWGVWWFYACIIFTFMLTGLWHGAGLATHNVRGRAVRLLRLDRAPKLHHVLQSLFVFGLVGIANIFFRVQDTAQAFEILRSLVFGWGSSAFSFLFCNNYCAFYSLGIGRRDLLLVFVSTAFLLAVDYFIFTEARLPKLFFRRPVRWACYYAFALWFLAVGYFAPETFIYFQF